jgi:EAL and modified HD-GYP domain-containing signal transduction protein
MDAIKSIFKKPDIENLLGDIGGILGPQDFEIVAVRGDCEIIYANEMAKSRMYTEQGYSHYCKESYAANFPGICVQCPYGGYHKKAKPETFEIKDNENMTYQVRRNTIKWIDGIPASVFMMRDITHEIDAKKRLYSLAYIDQLTGIPNRQKLKEDFSALEERIENNQLTGIIALFDLDRFKAINDTYGHNTGDIILRRLTEHLENEQAFSGHLYRLGGDEFVLLYSDLPEIFISEEIMLQHYNDILSTALHSYTLPNINLECTISIGVSVFPKHGSNLSEVLRKADIALYKAKEAGRNQVAFFSDHYETAQKFKDVYINIQPILNAAGKTFGYELIDCGTDDEDDNTVSLKEFDHTLDALGLNDIEGDRHYFITYSKQLLNPAVLKNLPKDKFIVQMSLPAKITKTKLQSDIKTYGELRKNGYKLALSGIQSGSPVEELISLADYCKFSDTDKNYMQQKKIIKLYYGKRFVATKVDKRKDFLVARDAGFHLFQGFYFNEPVQEKKTKEISPLKINYLRLLKLSNTDGHMDFQEIASIISSDVALSYKLLRILNSAAVGLRNISSINSAVTYLGEESLKKWIAVLALRGIAEDKPLELVRFSLIRARFGELLAPHFRIRRNPQKVFMVGLLSLLHIAMDTTREELLVDIPVEDDIRESLLTKTGIYSDLLHFYDNYEYSNWELVSQFVDKNQMDASFVKDSYIASVKWYNDLAIA